MQSRRKSAGAFFIAALRLSTAQFGSALASGLARLSPRRSGLLCRQGSNERECGIDRLAFASSPKADGPARTICFQRQKPNNDAAKRRLTDWFY